MQSKNVLLIYFFALIAGVLLLLFNGRAQLFETIVTVIGVMFLVVCCWTLLQTVMVRKPAEARRAEEKRKSKEAAAAKAAPSAKTEKTKNAKEETAKTTSEKAVAEKTTQPKADAEPARASVETEKSGSSKLMLIPALGGILFGILLICMPAFFVKYLIYTFGVLMTLCGLAQLIYTIPGMRWMELSRWWLLPPLVVMAIGIGVFVAGAKEVEKTITILTGIVLTVYSIEGFIGWLNRRSRLRRMETLTHEPEV